MENKKYLKISEFAKMANVSRQTIYNDLSSKLTDFVKDLTPLDSQFTVKFDNDLTAFLQSQIEEKDKQIERLYSMLDKEREQSKEKDKTIQENNEHIREQEKRLADLLEQSQQLNHNNQVLLLKEKESKTKGLFKRLFAKSEE